jgi:Ca2+-binding RTX toxin-like protein
MEKDNEYLKLTDLAYLAFKNDDKKFKNILDIFNKREEILIDADASGEIETCNVKGEDEKKLWQESQRAYWDAKKTYFGEEFLTKWKVISVCNNNNKGTGIGLFGVAFQNLETDEVVFSFRGTEGGNPKELPKDMLMADLQIVMGVIPEQYREAAAWYDEIMDDTKLEIDPSKTTIAGHSLGGGIAQYVATVGEKQASALRTFNGVGVSTHQYLNANDFLGYSDGLYSMFDDIGDDLKSEFTQTAKRYVQDIWDNLSLFKKTSIIFGAGLFMAGGVGATVTLGCNFILNAIMTALSGGASIVELVKDNPILLAYIAKEGLKNPFEKDENDLNILDVNKLENEILPMIKEIMLLSENQKEKALKIIEDMSNKGLIKLAGEIEKKEAGIYEIIEKNSEEVNKYFDSLQNEEIFLDYCSSMTELDNITSKMLNSEEFNSLFNSGGDNRNIINLFLDNLALPEIDGEITVEKIKDNFIEKFMEVSNFATNFSERKNTTNYKNYVHSSDMTGTIYNHLGETYSIDKSLTEESDLGCDTYIEATEGTYSFLAQLFSTVAGFSDEKEIKKYHMYDVLTAFMVEEDNSNLENKSNEYLDRINSYYLKSVISRFVEDGYLDAETINQFYLSIDSLNPNGESDILISELLKILQNSENKKYLEERNINLDTEIIASLSKYKDTYNFKELLSNLYTKNDLGEIIENKEIEANTSYFDYWLKPHKFSELVSKNLLNGEDYRAGINHVLGVDGVRDGYHNKYGAVSFSPYIISDEKILKYQSKNHIIFGNELGNVIKANDDSDSPFNYSENTIFAGAGDDFVHAGKGEDIIYGGKGNDVLLGAAYAGFREKDGCADRLIGGEGNDLLVGGSGTDEYIYNVSEDSGIDLIEDTDKLGKVILVSEEGIRKEIKGSLIRDDKTIENYLGKKLRDFNGNLITWDYGIEKRGEIREKGTSVTIFYTNSLGKKNQIGISGLMDRYTMHGRLLQEEIVGLKFESRFTGEIKNFESSPIATLNANYTDIISFEFGQMGSQFSNVFGKTIESEKSICVKDPLILDLDGDGIETASMEEGVHFDLDGDGTKEKSGWIGKDDGFLVYDKNFNGTIDSGRELFGDQTRLKTGRMADSGFSALAEFDSNDDGVVNELDSDFKKLKIWQDENSDGISQISELKTLKEAGISLINLDNQETNVEQNGNIEVRTASFTKEDGTENKISEYMFLNNIYDTVSNDDIIISEEIKQMINVSGNGIVQELQKAMEVDETGELKHWVKTFVIERNPRIRRDLLENEFLFQWAGVSKVDKNSRGLYFDARKLETMERFFGIYTGINPSKFQAPELESIYSKLMEKVYIDMMIQTHLKPYFDVIGGIEKDEDYYYNLTNAQEKIQEVIDDDFTYGNEVLHDFVTALRIYGIDKRSDFTEFCDSFSLQSEELEWQVDSAARNVLEGNRTLEIGEVIKGTSNADAINGHYGNDSLSGGSGDDYLFGESGDDSLYGESGNDVLRGGDGSDSLFGNSGSDELAGGLGNDILVGGSGDDILVGDLGDDTLKGGSGNDTYIYSLGSGNDVIEESGGTDTVNAEFINSDDVIFSIERLHLIMTVKTMNESLTVKDYFRSEENRIENFKFEDTTLTFENIVEKLNILLGTSESDILISEGQLTLGEGGDDFIREAHIASGGLGNDDILGNNTDDLLYGGSGDDILEGNDGNDFLAGEAGDDRYLIKKYSGHNTIEDSSGANIIEFIDVESNEVKLYRKGNNLEFYVEEEKLVTINNFFTNFSVDIILFSDNVLWPSKKLKDQVIYIEGSDFRDDIDYNDGYKYSMEALDNNDTILLGKENDYIDGGKGDDYLLGENMDDTIVGGMGDDAIYGDNDSETTPVVFTFDDVFIQATSDNKITQKQIVEITGDPDGIIYDSEKELQKQLDRIASGNDTLYGGFGNDYIEGGDKDDQLYGDEGNDHLMGDGYIIKCNEMSASKIYWNGNDTLYGGEGDDLIEGSKGNDTLYGGYGDDVLIADGYDEIDGFIVGDSTKVDHIGNDYLDGGEGNDILKGLKGNDKYIFRKGYSHDEVVELGGDDTLVMDGILSTEVNFERKMDSLVIKIDDFDQIKLTDYFKRNEDGTLGDYVVETIQFCDGVNLSYDDVINKMAINGSSEDDVIIGEEGNDIILGNDGNDEIEGSYGLDVIYGGSGNDNIDGGMEDDTIWGQSGNDIIKGSYGNDSLFGGSGNDNIYGNTENDYLDGGSGNDYLDGGAGDDKLFGQTGDDIINGGLNEDIIYGGSGNDTLIGDTGEDKIYGGEGNDIIRAGSEDDYIISDEDDSEGNDTIYGQEGDDYIKSGAGDDTIDGGEGNDRIIGGKGSDTYIFGISSGTDNIVDTGDLSIDVIKMLEGITKENIEIRKNKYDLIIFIKGYNDSLIINDYFRSDENQVELIEFSDGSIFDLKSVTDEWIIRGTEGDDILFGTEGDDVIFGLGGNDIIYSYGGDDTVNGGSGDDTIYGGAGNDYIEGEDGNDILDGGSGNDELIGGAGDDTYVFAKGYDKDIVIEDRDTNPTDKTIVQINNLSPEDISFMKVGKNLEIFAEGTAARLVIERFFADNRNRIDEIQFSNGEIWSLEDIKNKPIYLLGTEEDDGFIALEKKGFLSFLSFLQTKEEKIKDFSDYRFIVDARDGDDWYETGNKDDVLYGGAGNDILRAKAGNDLIRGGLGHDKISGGLGDDIISGDEGNDEISGGAGNDVINGGYGNDEIFGESGNDILVDKLGNNKISGGKGEDKIVSGEGNDDISGGSGNDEINSNSGDDSVYGGSGNDIIHAGIGNDIIYGGEGDDDIYGESGNDIIYGNAGDDYYYFGIGDGHDTVYEENWGFDKIIFKAGVVEENIKIQKCLFDLILNITDSEGIISDSITVKNYFASPYNQIEKILFDNGTEWDTFDISEHLKIYGTNNDDTIIGTEYGDLIYAEDGNDTVDALGDNDGIRGGLGNDVLHGNAGDDIIYGEAGSDTIYGDEGDDLIEGHTGADTIYGGEGNDIINAGEDNDIVSGEIGNDIIRAGTGKDEVYGNEGNDVIYGETDNDKLYGNEGNDIIYGGEGNDIIDGGLNDDLLIGGIGSDEISGGLGNDKIYATSKGSKSNETDIYEGENTLRGNEGNDVIYGGINKDYIYGGSGADNLYGKEGDDHIEGNEGNDSISGGEGNDIIYGGEGNDHIMGIISYYNSLDDTYIELEDQDDIHGGAGDDVIIDGLGDTITYGDAGNDTIKTGRGDDIIYGGSENDKLYGESGYDKLYGESGSDSLYGGKGSDQLYGGEGNDYLEGGEGEDKYIFNLNFGQDTLYDYDEKLENIDTIVFGEGILETMVALRRDIYDLIVEIKNSTDKIVIKNYFKSDYSKIEYIEFFDGNKWDAEKIRERVGIIYGTSLGESLLGSDVNNLMYGLAGDDILLGKEGDDIIEGGDGNDYIEGNEGKDDLKGGLGSDEIHGGLDDDIIYGGAGHDIILGESGNDKLYGEDGDDNIEGNSGSDIIYSGKGNDKVYGGLDNDAIYGGTGDDYIEGNEGDDYINASSGDDIVYGNEGNDTILLGAGIDRAEGGLGNDIIKGDMSDTVEGNEGNDRISSVYKAFGGEGDDVLSNVYISEGGQGNDTIYLARNGISKGNEGNDYLYGSSGSDTIEGNEGNDYLNGNSRNDNLYGNEGNDTIEGGHGDDYIEGGIGDDTLADRSGNDIYFFEKVFGNDTIHDIGGNLDRIRFGLEISLDMLEFSNINYDLLIKVNNFESSITIKNYFNSLSTQIELLEFIDGSSYKIKELISEITFIGIEGTENDDILNGVSSIVGNSGNDKIRGSVIADKINGGQGNDTLEGLSGNDTYYFYQGDGQDVIVDYDSTLNNNDTIIIDGIKADYSIKRENQNLIISSIKSEDTITIVNYFLNDIYKIETIKFSDDSEITFEECSNIILFGTDNADILTGGTGNDIIDGGLGNDTLKGLSGDDTYRYDAGYGNDIIMEESGNDTILLGENILIDDVTLRQVDLDLQLVLESTGETLTVKSYYNPYKDKKIEQIKFSDGTVWDAEKIAEIRLYQFGSLYNDMMEGTGKSDYINGWEGDDLLSGGAGNDIIEGGYGDDRLTGGLGIDTLNGGYGNDIYYLSANTGLDIINDNQGNDTIKFSSDLTTEDVRVERNGNNLDIFSKNEDGLEERIAIIQNYYVSPSWWNKNPYRIENLEFSDGNIWDSIKLEELAYNFYGSDLEDTFKSYDHSLKIFANKGDDILTGSNHSDELYGEEGKDIINANQGNDIISGGKGDDILNGGYGLDTYIYNLGDGNDTIFDNAYGTYWSRGDSSNDKIKFGYGIFKEDINFIKINNDLEISFKTNEGKIKIKNYFKEEGRYYRYGGTFNPYRVEEIEFFDGEILNIWEILEPGVSIGEATENDDVLETGKAINSIIYGQAGNDTLIGNEKTDSLYGGSGDDTLQGGNGNDFLFGGSGLDKLQGGLGNDVLEGNEGSDYLEGAFGSDTYIFEKGFGIDIINDSSYNGYRGYGDNGIDKIKFGDGISKEDLYLVKNFNNLEIRISNSSDKIIIENYFKEERRYYRYGGNFNPYTIEKIEFYDSEVINLKELFQERTILEESTENNDLVETSIKTDVIVHGLEGNDILYGNQGNDILYGDSGDDILYGNQGNDTIYGGVGNDTIYGGEGTNEIFYDLGDGIDTIKTTPNSINILNLGNTIDKNKVIITREDHNLVIFDGETLDKIVVENWYFGNKLNEIKFADGSNYDLTELHNQGLVVRGTENDDEIVGEGTENDELHGESGNDKLYGLEGNDTLYGGAGNDVIYGGQGDDILEGGQGDDTLYGGLGVNTYNYSLGAGNDIIKPEKSSNDIIKFEDTLTKESISLTREGHNLIINILNSEDKLVVENWYLGNTLEKFVFSDGVEMLREEIHTKGLVVKGTDDEDTMEGLDKENNVIYGLFGNDVITTYSGNDVVYGESGDDIINLGEGINKAFGGQGNDEIISGSGDDIIYGDEGNDNILSGAGNDTIYGGQGDDILEGGQGINTYVYGLNNGKDIIKVQENSVDIVKFVDDLTKDSISLTREGHNLIVNILNSEDRLVVENWYLGNTLEKFVFSDGIEMLQDEIHTKGLIVRGTDSDDEITGEGRENDVLYGDLGNDSISGGYGNDELYGNEGDDIIFGDQGDDILEGGKGTDILEGGAGNNIYRYSLGDGNDTLKIETELSFDEYDWKWKARQDWTGINWSDGGSDAFDGFGNTTISINNQSYEINFGKADGVLKEQNIGNVRLNSRAKFIGSNILELYLETPEILEESVNIKIGGNMGSDGNEEFSTGTISLNGINIPYAYSIDKRGYDPSLFFMLIPSVIDDELIYSRSRDSIYGTINKVYFPLKALIIPHKESKEELLNIIDLISKNSLKENILKLEEGLTKENIMITREGYNLVIFTPDSEDKITIKDWYLGKKLSKIIFSDGSEILQDEIHTKGLIVRGTDSNDMLEGLDKEDNVIYGLLGNDEIISGSGDDIIYGNEGNDNILSGAGNDTIYGGQGDDILEGGQGINTYVYGLNNGKDIIKVQENSVDIVKFVDDLTKDSISLTREGHNLIVNILNSEDRLVVENWYLGNTLEKFVFSDGIEMLQDEIHTKGLIVRGTDSNDMLEGLDKEDNVIHGLLGNDEIISGSGNDVVHGELGDDIINLGDGANEAYGGQGNDKIISGSGNDFLYGNEGNDIIYSGSGNDVVNGGLDGDTLYGDEGNDILYGDEGNDVINGGLGNDNIYGGLDSDTLYGNEGDDTLYGDEGNDILYGDEGNDVINGGLGNDNIYGGLDSDTLYGNEGDDTLYGEIGNDIISGGLGNDTIFGGSGNNTYLFNLGDGNDTINLISYSHDILKFGESITKDSVVFTREDMNLIIYTENENDKIIVKDWYSGNKLEKIIFSDGTEMITEEIHVKGLVVKGTSDSDTILGLNKEADVLYGLAGDDIINGLSNDDEIYGNEGNDIIDGGYGDDNYYYSLGDGNDIITDLSGYDTLNLSDINFSDIKHIRRLNKDSKDVIITFNNNEEITLISQMNSNINNYIFKDKSFTHFEFIKLIKDIKASDEDDYISGYETSEIIYSGLGNDNIYADSGDDIIYGEEGSDKIVGGQGNDIIDGGQGNDIMFGYEGDDTYIFRKNEGNDVIYENDYLGNSDSVVLEGINKGDITLLRDFNHLILKIDTTGETLTLFDYFSGVSNKVEEFLFDNGEIWNKESIKDYFGYDKNNFNIVLNEDSYTINFEKYNTQISIQIFSETQGQLNSVTYYNYKTAGTQRHFELLGMDEKIKEMLNNYLEQMLELNIDFENLTEIFNSYSEELREIAVQCFEFRDDFTDNTVLGSVTPLEILGDANDNILEGDIFGDILDGNFGNDILIGNSGDDTYIFGAGYGEDIIIDFDNLNNNIDTIQMKDINSTDVSIIRNGYDLEIISNSDKLIVKNYFDGLKYKVERIEFYDQVVWNREIINNLINQDISSYNINIESDSLFSVEFSIGELQIKVDYETDNNDISSLITITYSNRKEYDAFISSEEYAILRNQALELCSSFVESNMPLENWMTTLENNFDNLEELVAQTMVYSDINFDYVLYNSNLTGTDGADSLRGTNESDVLDGGLGNDQLEGGLGNDIYIFGKGYGEDIIIENDNIAGNVDIIEMKDISSSEIVLVKDGLNLDLICGSDKLIIKNYFSDESNKIEKIIFSDNVTFTDENIESLIGIEENKYNISVISDMSFSFSFIRCEIEVTVSYDNGSFAWNLRGYQDALDNFVNSEEYNKLSGQINTYANQVYNSGIDLSTCIISIPNNFDILNNIIESSFEILVQENSDDSNVEFDYVGTEADDIFVGNSNDEVFDGKSGNDQLDGKSGNDTYIFGKGYGDDVIMDSDNSIGNHDVIKMNDITSEEVTINKNGYNLEILSGMDKLTVTNYFDGLNNKIERIEFSDNKFWTESTINQKLNLGAQGIIVNNISDTSFELNYKYGLVNVMRRIYMENGYMCAAGTGFSYSTQDELNHGQAFANGFNNFYNEFFNSDIDKANWTTELINRARDFNSLLNQSFQLSNTSSMNLESTEEDTFLYGGENNDILTGNVGMDVFVGSFGNDELIGNSGDDTYIFNLGDGQDTIIDIEGSDKLIMDVNPLDLIFKKNNSDLEIDIYGSDDKILVKNWENGEKIETIEVAQNLSINSDAIEQLIQEISAFSSSNQNITWDTAINEKNEEIQVILSQYYK